MGIRQWHCGDAAEVFAIANEIKAVEVVISWNPGVYHICKGQPVYTTIYTYSMN